MRIAAGVVGTCTVMFSSVWFPPNALASAQGPEKIAEFRRELIQDLPDGFFTPATTPTAPVPVDRLYAEWEPASRALISVPLPIVLAEPQTLSFVIEFLEATVAHIPVGILFDREEERRLGRFIREIEKSEVLKAHAETRIDYVESRSQNFWIRDHGPQFGQAKNGDLLVIDPIYRQLEAIAVNEGDSSMGNLNNIDYANDLTPQYIGKYLRSFHEYETIPSRPPLHFHGGDFASDGRGNVFLTEDTVLENGENWDRIEMIFDQYLGAENVYVLSSPNGKTARHLDVLLKAVSENTIFVTKAPALQPGASIYNRTMREQLKRTVANNIAYLNRNLPEKRIVQLPMPSPFVKKRDARLNRLRKEITQIVCRKAGVEYSLATNPNHKLKGVEAARSAVALEILMDTGLNINFNNDEHLETLSRKYLGLSVQEYLDTYVDDWIFYRSYVNSLIIVNEQSETLILLPRFSPQEGESQDEYDAMEKEVENRYSEVYPSAALKWVNCDTISALGGSLHCMSITVPVRKGLNKSKRVSNKT